MRDCSKLDSCGNLQKSGLLVFLDCIVGFVLFSAFNAVARGVGGSCFFNGGFLRFFGDEARQGANAFLVRCGDAGLRRFLLFGFIRKGLQYAELEKLVRKLQGGDIFVGGENAFRRPVGAERCSCRNIYALVPKPRRRQLLFVHDKFPFGIYVPLRIYWCCGLCFCMVPPFGVDFSL